MNKNQKYLIGIIIVIGILGISYTQQNLNLAQMTPLCTDTRDFYVGQAYNMCGVSVKLGSVTENGIHTGFQSRYSLTYPDGYTEEWVFNDPSAKYYLYKAYSFENSATGLAGSVSRLKVTQYQDTIPIPTPVPTYNPNPTYTPVPTSYVPPTGYTCPNGQVVSDPMYCSIAPTYTPIPTSTVTVQPTTVQTLPPTSGGETFDTNTITYIAIGAVLLFGIYVLFTPKNKKGRK